MKFCSSASAHGKYWIFFGLKFRLRTRNILRLKVTQFRFRIQNSLWLGALKWWNSAFAQGKYCGLEVTQFRIHTINLVRLEVPQFRTIYCDLNCRNSTSARKDVVWNSALLLLYENIMFLWKIHYHSTIHLFLNFRTVLHEWWTLWRTEKQRNRDAPVKSRR